MSARELERVEVMGRVGGGELKLKDATVMLQLIYRQIKRLWRRYRRAGRAGQQHGNASLASLQTGEVSTESAAVDAAEVFRIGGGAIWANAGGGVLGGKKTGW